MLQLYRYFLSNYQRVTAIWPFRLGHKNIVYEDIYVGISFIILLSLSIEMNESKREKNTIPTYSVLFKELTRKILNTSNF